MNDFIIHFCIDRAFQPKTLLYINLMPDYVEYAYMDGKKTISVKEPVKWDF
jgi:hypothetical protein